jgi:2-dehydropantoate 2-reductase
MLQDSRMRRVALRTYSEVIETADALGITLERIAANPRLLYVPEDAGRLTWWVKDLLARFVGRKYGRLKSSSLQSLERGRKTEIDTLNAYVVEQAKAVQVPTPVNALLVRFVKEIESGQRPIAPDNLDDLLSAMSRASP